MRLAHAVQASAFLVVVLSESLKGSVTVKVTP
jgi:hypothetical protein